MKRIFLACGFLFFVWTSAQAATFYVATTGGGSTCSLASPCATINACIAAMSSGDTCTIAAGTYHDIISSLSQAIPSGSSWANPTTIKATVAGTVTIVPTGTTFCCAVYLGSGEQYIVFDGLIWDGTASDTRGGPSFKDGANYIRVTNSVAQNFLDTGFSSTGTGHEFIGNASHDNGQNCNAVGEGAGHCHGFYISSSNTLIELNDVYSNEGYGIHVYGGSTSGTILRRNTVHSNGIGGAAGTGPSAGIILSSGTGVLAYNNVVRDNPAGIQVQYSCLSCLVYNNTIYDNSRTAPSTPNYCLYNGSDSPGTVFRNNICYQNVDGIIDADTLTQSNNLLTDPLFVNAAGLDFHLQAGSSAINAGADLSAVFTTDGEGRVRRLPFDIGAFEYGMAVSFGGTVSVGGVINVGQ